MLSSLGILFFVFQRVILHSQSSDAVGLETSVVRLSLDSGNCEGTNSNKLLYPDPI